MLVHPEGKKSFPALIGTAICVFLFLVLCLYSDLQLHSSSTIFLFFLLSIRLSLIIYTRVLKPSYDSQEPERTSVWKRTQENADSNDTPL